MTFDKLVAQTSAKITELMPWDLAEKLEQQEELILVDVRESDEFNNMHIPNAINIPRGVLEAASEEGYDETNPKLANARDKQVIVICRSGKRSCLAAYTLQLLGFNKVSSLKTGLRGWNDYDQVLVNSSHSEIDGDIAEDYLKPGNAH